MVALYVIIALILVFFTVFLPIFLVKKGGIKEHKKDRVLKQVGNKGEFMVARILNSLDGRLINNFKFVTKDHRTHQIDHIFINAAGVFVIETKMFAGLIRGNELDDYWHFFPFDRRPGEERRNPIDQNNIQKKVITNLIKIKVPIYSFVVYATGDLSELNVSNVISINEVVNFINSKPKTLSSTAIDNLYNFLCKENKIDISEENHIKNIKEHHKK